jgi:hypothetical protein
MNDEVLQSLDGKIKPQNLFYRHRPSAKINFPGKFEVISDTFLFIS